MSSHLRDDNECQNCGYTVEMAYCTKCGQKNTETRQPFHHLFTHFIEDLTHSDGAFWKTIKHLLFRPGRLTKEYLEGKRQTYVPPVKLYIFISFITFFILSFMSNDGNVVKYDTAKGSSEMGISGATNKSLNDDFEYTTDNKTFHSLQELIEFQESASESEKLDFPNYWFAKAVLNVKDKKVSRAEFLHALVNTLSKVLFLYMPIFAFWLWMLHGKRRWYFFDHGIFTLHYFSLLLMLMIIYMASFALLNLIPSKIIEYSISTFIALILNIYAVFYFFRSHRRMYGEKRWISRLKGFILLWINLIFIFIFLLIGLVYAMLSIH